MANVPQTEKNPEARLLELERHVTRLRIGLIAVASLILWQATSEMGWLGPLRIYATEVYASEFILEDAERNVHGRWKTYEGSPAQLMVFGSGPGYVRLSAEGLEKLESEDILE